MPTCVTLDTAVNLTPDCIALRKEGGAKKVFYVGSISEIAAEGQGPAGQLTSLTIATSKKLIRLEGKKEKNSADVSSEQGENGPSYTHNANFIAYYSTQGEKQTIEALGAMDDLYVIVPTASGQVEAYGLYGSNGIADGMSMTVTGGTGTAKTDSAALTLAFSGATSRMPVYVELGVDFDDTISALEALTVAQV
jgi:hypothetical protein